MTLERLVRAKLWKDFESQSEFLLILYTWKNVDFF